MDGIVVSKGSQIVMSMFFESDVNPAPRVEVAADCGEEYEDYPHPMLSENVTKLSYTLEDGSWGKITDDDLAEFLLYVARRFFGYINVKNPDIEQMQPWIDAYYELGQTEARYGIEMTSSQKKPVFGVLDLHADAGAASYGMGKTASLDATALRDAERPVFQIRLSDTLKALGEERCNKAAAAILMDMAARVKHAEAIRSGKFGHAFIVEDDGSMTEVGP